MVLDYSFEILVRYWKVIRFFSAGNCKIIGTIFLGSEWKLDLFVVENKLNSKKAKKAHLAQSVGGCYLFSIGQSKCCSVASYHFATTIIRDRNKKKQHQCFLRHVWSAEKVFYKSFKIHCRIHHRHMSKYRDNCNNCSS